MDASSSSSLQSQQCNNCLPRHGADNRDDKGSIIVDSDDHCSRPEVENHTSGSSNSELKRTNRCKKRTSLKKRIAVDASELPSSSFSPSSSMGSSHRGVGVACKRRNPRALVRRNGGDVAAIGLPLGMSFAAVMAQVRPLFFSLPFFFLYFVADYILVILTN